MSQGNGTASPATRRVYTSTFRAPQWYGPNTLSSKAAQIPMVLRHHARNFATQSAHTLEANISSGTTNHPAHQRHATFTPPCFAPPSGTAPRKSTSHPGRATPTGTATRRPWFRHTVCPHTEKQTYYVIPPFIPLTSDTPPELNENPSLRIRE